MLFKKIVNIACTIIVGLLLALTAWFIYPSLNVCIGLLAYFFFFWVLPAKIYTEEQDGKKLVYRFLTAIIHVLVLVITIYHAMTTSYNHSNIVCAIAVVFLILNFLLLVPSFVPFIVYLDRNKNARIVEDVVRRRRLERGRWRQQNDSEAISQANSRMASNPFQSTLHTNDNTNSHASGSDMLVCTQAMIDDTQGITIDNHRDIEHKAYKPIVSYDEAHLLPSYSELEDNDLPDYEAL